MEIMENLHEVLQSGFFSGYKYGTSVRGKGS